MMGQNTLTRTVSVLAIDSSGPSRAPAAHD